MAARSDSRSLVLKCVYLTLIVAAHAAPNQDTCDRVRCPGPLKYYEDMGCTPVYENPGDCCAKEYNCDKVKNLSKNQCHVNNNVYNIGDKLKDEDANPCDIGCTCRAGRNDVAEFTCAVVDCFQMPPKPGCYRKNSPSQCCAGEEVCPEKEEDRATCTVDGVVYRDGEAFTPKSDPDLNCYCMPGYAGENIEPFCKKPAHPYCSPLFRNANNVHENCAPVYYSSQVPQKDCSVFSRCQNKNDSVIHSHGKSSSEGTSGSTCKFGNLEMHLGDELNQKTDYDSVCVKCVCEVPPVPTCQRLPDEECDVTDHGPFH